MRRHGVALLLVAFFLLALSLRLWGIGFGLPNLYHPDEDAVVMPAINIVKTGNLEPIRLEYGSLHIYLLALVSAAVFLLSARAGYISDPTTLSLFERGAYPRVYMHPEYFLAARVVSAVLGALVVLWIFMLARRLASERIAVIAAALGAVLPALVVDAHFATTDTPLMFWATLALYLLLRAYDNWFEDSLWAYAGAGFVCGLATATKYNGVVLAVPLLLVPLLRVRSLDEMVRMRVLAGPLAMAAGFVSAVPYALLNLPNFLNWFAYSLRLYNAPREVAMSAWQWHLAYHLSSSHAVVFFLGLAGLLFSFFFWGRRAILPSSFAIVLWIAILSQTNYQARMWLPAAPLFLIYAAFMLDLLAGAVARRWLPRHTRTFACAPLLLPLLLLPASANHARAFTEDDVRTRAQRWIEANIPTGTAIAMDYYGPNLSPDRWPVTKLFHLAHEELPWYEERGIKFLVVSEAVYNEGNVPPTLAEQYQVLLQQSCLRQTLSGPFLSNPDFQIWVYEAPPC